MPEGKTLQMIEFSRVMRWGRLPMDDTPRERDRSLAGKKRIRARKAARRVVE